ncbi:NADPH-dependent FMN reductase [Sphingomonas prati]|uniref:NAD(P)H-dependent FMN reductase n=1 Tax=Sphingomonas prati TaxID=1843237 RepID=A0A7W9BV76_9SPHN|nr:NADPH-dependent FMN reductase [Sphingomonas prati]MBB5730732.1 NAD(P)H-dependent FMN reductase [Sphingomonas prati]GGE95662.1 FMN reductase [Sphingomonas prati]
MADRILVFYGSYRSDRMGIRLVNYIMAGLRARGAAPELIDAKAVGLPMLDRMYKEHAAGTAPQAMETLAGKIREADAYLFVVGEYNWNVQAGLKNLIDHYLEEWAWRPGAIASYSAGRVAGARANLAWHGILPELGIAVVPRTLTVGSIGDALNADGVPTGAGGAALEKAFPRFAEDLAWWTAATREARARGVPGSS